MLDAIKRNHANLHQRTLPNLFAKLSDAQLRARPRPETNSIAWNIWHLLRIEDITLNRFVALTPQLYTSGGWQERLGIAYGDMGTAGIWEQLSEGAPLSRAMAAYPDVFGLFAGFADDAKVESGWLKLPDRPGIGFEAQNALYAVMKDLSR